MKKLMVFAMLMVFLVSLALGGCSNTPNTGSSSYEKSKSGSNKPAGGSSGGY